MAASLNSVRLKLVRADEHFKAIEELLLGFSIGECKIIPEENKKTHIGFLRVHLPKPPEQLPLLIADFLYNIRSAFDHLVFHLVRPNTGGVKDRSAFPICDSPANFESQKKRHRLVGIPERAVTLMESLQPYPGRNQTLRTLATLHERDKHKTLNLVTAVASDTRIEWKSGNRTFVDMFLGGEELRHGAILGGIGMPLNNPDLLEFLRNGETLAHFRERFLNMKVEGEASMFVAFGDTTAEELEPLRVETVLQEIIEFIRDTAVPAFEPFFN
jgi:hypothetical protein